MNSSSPISFTIGQKLGLVFLLLVALLGIVCLVVVLMLRGMQLDAARVHEEAQEEGFSQRLLADLDSLGYQIASLRQAADYTPPTQARLRTHIESIRATAQRFATGPDGRDDPSREEHQQEEMRILEVLEEELSALEAGLAIGMPGEQPRHLERSRRLARVLVEEMKGEAAEANADLLERKRAATWIMVGTLIAIALALLAVLWIVRRAVVEPIRLLQSRAESLGRGEPIPPGRIRSRDEIGALARSFSEMAERVAATREDLEERVAARTREFLRAARYAELGVLAAGIAHEVNNPLASIASCAEGLQRRLQRGPVEPEEQSEYLETIVSQAYRAREVTSRLLALARQDARIFRLVNLSEVCEQTARITRYQLEQVGVQLELDLDPQPIYVEGDALELGQMLVNLIVNGRDASPAGGSVFLRCHLVGDNALIQVDDEGQGVPMEHQDRVFEPFFTTKRAGEGTGLGLALVHAIVKAHAGQVTLAAAPTGGARFQIQLPAVDPVEHA